MPRRSGHQARRGQALRKENRRSIQFYRLPLWREATRRTPTTMGKRLSRSSFLNGTFSLYSRLEDYKLLPLPLGKGAPSWVVRIIQKAVWWDAQNWWNLTRRRWNHQCPWTTILVASGPGNGSYDDGQPLYSKWQAGNTQGKAKYRRHGSTGTKFFWIEKLLRPDDLVSSNSWLLWRPSLS